MSVSPRPLMTPDQLGTLLQSSRKSKRISQSRLAVRLGLSQSRVSHLELHPEQMSVEQLMGWCAALGLELSLGARSNLPAEPTSTSGAW